MHIWVNTFEFHSRNQSAVSRQFTHMHRTFGRADGCENVCGPIHYASMHVFTPKAEELRTCVCESKEEEEAKTTQ